MSDYKPPEEISKAEKIIKYQKDNKDTKSFHLLNAKIKAVEKNLIGGDGKVDYKKLLDNNVAKTYREDIINNIK